MAIQPQLQLHPERLFGANKTQRSIAKRLYQEVFDLPIISPHGHTDPRWFADNQPFDNAAALIVQPDHYLLRMLYSLGVPLERLGIGAGSSQVEPRAVWQCFAEHYYAFRGTPSRLWLDTIFSEIFGFEVVLNKATSDDYFDRINECLALPAFLPRQLFERFNIELLATTESPLDDLRHHQKIQQSDWQGRVISAYRPDCVTDPEHNGFLQNLETLSAITGEQLNSFSSYLNALAIRRAFFKKNGATSTDHGNPSVKTADLDEQQKKALYEKVRSGVQTSQEAELFRAQMLTEMALMSIDDGLVMQIHPGSYRNHNKQVLDNFGSDKGADIPLQIEYVKALQPLLNNVGNHRELTIILFTLDETAYSRELAPLAGHYPALKLGPAWWFHDSPEGMRRYREQVTETAGFYNTVGFNDDTRAFLSIPARHDVARRMDCNFLAQLVAEHRLNEDEALEVAHDLSYGLVKKTYKL